MQNGNTAAHTGLEEIADVLLFCQSQQLKTSLRHQLLVGGYNMLARLQSTPGVLIGRVYPANGFHHHADALVLFNPPEVIRHQLTVGAILEMPHQNGFHLQRLSQLPLNLPGVFRHYPGNAGADGSKAQNCNLYHA